jgi:hypothetical protein
MKNLSTIKKSSKKDIDYEKYWKAFQILTFAIAVAAIFVSSFALTGIKFKSITNLDFSFNVGDPEIWKSTNVLPCTDKPLGSDHTSFEGSTFLAINCPPVENSCRASTCNADGTCSDDLASGAECSSDSYCLKSEKCDLDLCTCVSSLGTYTPVFVSNTLFSMESVIDTTPNSVSAYYDNMGEFIRVDISYNFNISIENSTNLGFDFSLPFSANDTETGVGSFILFSVDIPLIGNEDEYNFIASYINILNSTYARASGVNQNNLWMESVASNTTLSGSLSFLYLSS